MIGDKPSCRLGPDQRPNYIQGLPFIAVNLIGLVSLIVGILTSLGKIRWGGQTVSLFWIWCLTFSLWFSRMFFMTGFYHRYFSHRSFYMHPFWRAVAGALGCTAAQKGPLWWSSHHRHHHKYSDQPEDIHSVLYPRLSEVPDNSVLKFLRQLFGRHWKTVCGIYWAHTGWIFDPTFNPVQTNEIKELMSSWWLRKIDHYNLVPPTALAIACGYWGGYAGLFIGFFGSTFVLYHTVFSINSLAHLIGKKSGKTSDNSRNSLILAIITLGEGWHENHHFQMWVEMQAILWWEKFFDTTHWILVLLHYLHVVDLSRWANGQKIRWQTKSLAA